MNFVNIRLHLSIPQFFCTLLHTFFYYCFYCNIIVITKDLFHMTYMYIRACKYKSFV